MFTREARWPLRQPSDPRVPRKQMVDGRAGADNRVLARSDLLPLVSTRLRERDTCAGGRAAETPASRILFRTSVDHAPAAARILRPACTSPHFSRQAPRAVGGGNTDHGNVLRRRDVESQRSSGTSFSRIVRPEAPSEFAE